MQRTSIVICSSANFYKEVVEIQATLEKNGFTVLIPATAEKMKQSGDFEVSHYKTWFGNENDYHKKTALMRGHFDEIDRGDIMLVINNEKHGVKNYIGGNVLMEMAIAFHQNKPIYLLNSLPDESVFLEEIKGLNPIVLDGDLTKIKLK